MRMIYVFVGLLIITVVAIMSRGVNRKPGSDKIPDSPSADIAQPTKVDSAKNPYNDLRNLAFSAKPELFEVFPSAGQVVIYGVIMDWDVGEGIVTLVTFASGEASLYLSSGGGTIGGGEHEYVKKAALAFIGRAGEYLNKVDKTDKTALPDPGGVNFYFLTTQGIFKGQEKMENFENGSSEWLGLFEEGNNVITEFTKIEPK